MAKLAHDHALPAAGYHGPARDPLDAHLDGDSLGYDAWLLPPVELDKSERLLRAASFAAGPIALVATALGLALLF